MYEQFFGCRERPFDLSPNPRYLVLTESHQEALSSLEYAISSQKGITLLVGEAGSGKTTIIRTALDRQPARVHAVHISNPTLSRAEFVETLADRFGLSDLAKASKAVMLSELEALLRNRRERGELTVLVVDEAQSLPMDLLEEIRLLVNIETDEEKLISVIIAGQPELVDLLNGPQLRQLKQRVALRCELRPLTRQETATYLAGRIRAAGGVGAQVFTREAVTLIHDRSLGLPRTINVLADNALLGGFAAGKRPVPSDIVREVCQDFDLGQAVLATHDEAAVVEGLPAASKNGVNGQQPPLAPALTSGPSQDLNPALTSQLLKSQRFSVITQTTGTSSAPAPDHESEPPSKEPGILSALLAKGKRFSLFRS